MLKRKEGAEAKTKNRFFLLPSEVICHYFLSFLDDNEFFTCLFLSHFWKEKVYSDTQTYRYRLARWLTQDYSLVSPWKFKNQLQIQHNWSAEKARYADFWLHRFLFDLGTRIFENRSFVIFKNGFQRSIKIASWTLCIQKSTDSLFESSNFDLLHLSPKIIYNYWTRSQTATIRKINQREENAAWWGEDIYCDVYSLINLNNLNLFISKCCKKLKSSQKLAYPVRTTLKLEFNWDFLSPLNKSQNQLLLKEEDKCLMTIGSKSFLFQYSGKSLWFCF